MVAVLEGFSELPEQTLALLCETLAHALLLVNCSCPTEEVARILFYLHQLQARRPTARRCCVLLAERFDLARRYLARCDGVR